jgi:hypothetical protein
MAARTPAREVRAWAALAVLTWLAIEGLCAAALFALAHLRGVEVPSGARFRLEPAPRARLERILAGEEPYYPFDPELGWTVRPNGRLPLYRANAQGIRADVEYALEPPPGVLRIAAFGDSFVHGTEVANPDTWPALLAALRPGLEVLNFGVGGYGVDQAWLRWRRDGRRFAPQIVLIGFMTEDVHRSVNRFRPFQAPRHLEPRAKPRFALRDGGLALLPNPLPDLDAYRELLAREAEVIPRIGEGDAFYEALWKPAPLGALPSARLLRFARNALSPTRTLVGGRLNPRSEAFEVTARVIEAFHDEALAEGSLPVVVLLPTRGDFERRRDGKPDARAPLRDRLARKGVATLDALACFEPPRRVRTLVFMKGGHYGAPTNRVIARCLLEELDRLGARSRASMRSSGVRGWRGVAGSGPPDLTPLACGSLRAPRCRAPLAKSPPGSWPG